MSGMHSGGKTIAVSNGAEKESAAVRQILSHCKRDSFTVISIDEAMKSRVKTAVLLATEPGEFSNPQRFSVCVTEYSLAHLPAFSGFQNLITYSTELDGADFTARNIRSLGEGVTAFEIVGVGIIGRVRLKTDYKTSVSVALSAAAAAIAAGIPFADILEALNSMDHFDW